MAVRTTIQLVKDIMPTALEDPEITAIITQANEMVTRTLSGEGMEAGLLKDIETWLTAHIIAIGKERQVASEKVGDIWLTYNKNPSGFFQSTTYGQMVLILDTSGKFQTSNKQKASIVAIKQINR